MSILSPTFKGPVQLKIDGIYNVKGISLVCHEFGARIWTKLMRLDRGRPEIRSKSYSNRLLIDFLIRIQPSDLSSRRFLYEFGPRLIKFRPRLIENGQFIWKICQFHQKLVEFEYFWYKSTYFRYKSTIFNWIMDIRSI